MAANAKRIQPFGGGCCKFIFSKLPILLAGNLTASIKTKPLSPRNKGGGQSEIFNRIALLRFPPPAGGDNPQGRRQLAAQKPMHPTLHQPAFNPNPPKWSNKSNPAIKKTANSDSSPTVCGGQLLGNKIANFENTFPVAFPPIAAYIFPQVPLSGSATEPSAKSGPAFFQANVAQR